MYHFVKLNHDVTVYNRDDSLGMERVVHPFHAAGFKRYERFYSSFYEYDVIVIGTFPTCHVETVAQLIALGLPQRFLAVVHNPELLADDDVSATLAAAAGKLQLFTIAPHVNDYANDILEAEGLSNVAKAEWIVPIFPVIFPESCHDPRLAGPSGPASKQPACNRTAVWRGIEETRPAPVLELDEEEYRRKLRRSTLSAPEPEAEEGSGSSKGKDKKGSESKGGKQTGHASEADLDDYEGMGPAGLARRRGFCVQGKLDPSRRDYVSLFEDITSRKEALLASDFALVLLGKASGKGGKNVLHTPGHLEEEGLVMNYISLPFQVRVFAWCSACKAEPSNAIAKPLVGRLLSCVAHKS